MISRSQSCSWCHSTNSLDHPQVRFCSECGHRADLPRMECDCPQCTATPALRQAQAQRDMADLLKRFEASGGDLNKVLAGE